MSRTLTGWSFWGTRGSRGTEAPARQPGTHVNPLQRAGPIRVRAEIPSATRKRPFLNHADKRRGCGLLAAARVGPGGDRALDQGCVWFADEAAWKAYLAWHEVTRERYVRIATEGALLGSLIAHGVSPEMGVLSDGAGQFDVFVHALCWLHVERPLERLVPHNEKHRQAIERIRQRIWDLYTGLKAYQQASSLTARDALAKQFDELVADRTDYPSIDGVLKGMAADRAQLLLLLQRPEVPLHNK